MVRSLKQSSLHAQGKPNSLPQLYPEQAQLSLPIAFLVEFLRLTKENRHQMLTGQMTHPSEDGAERLKED